MPVTRENLIRRQLLADFNQFARRMRLQYLFYGEEKEPHPFHVKSDWNPPVQPSVALETFLEEVKFELATINIEKPKDNLSHGERGALKELSRDKNIILKEADKGTTTVVMNREDKIHEGQTLLNDINNYRPLEKPMVDTTAKRVQQVIKVTVDLQGCLLKNRSYARRLYYNHGKVYIIVKVIKCRIRRNNRF